MIHILTAGTKAYRRYIDRTVKAAKRFGYNTTVLDLGDLGIGEPYDVTFPTKRIEGYPARCPWKPTLIMEHLHGFTVYLDGDAVFLREIDELETGDYDIGITRREGKKEDHIWPHATYYLNAGVVMANPTPNAIKFLRLWQRTVPTTRTHSDQEALSNLAQEPPSFVRIREFPCATYNSILPGEHDPKIRHFKGGQKYG